MAIDKAGPIPDDALRIRTEAGEPEDRVIDDPEQGFPLAREMAAAAEPDHIAARNLRRDYPHRHDAMERARRLVEIAGQKAEDVRSGEEGIRAQVDDLIDELKDERQHLGLHPLYSDNLTPGVIQALEERLGVEYKYPVLHRMSRDGKKDVRLNPTREPNIYCAVRFENNEITDRRYYKLDDPEAFKGSDMWLVE